MSVKEQTIVESSTDWRKDDRFFDRDDPDKKYEFDDLIHQKTIILPSGVEVENLAETYVFLIKKGKLPLEEIAEYSDLSLEEVQKLADEELQPV